MLSCIVFGQATKNKKYEVIELERVGVPYTRIDLNGIIKTTVTGIGRIGFEGQDGFNGLGFLYNNVQLMFEGALVLGFDSNLYLSNARSIQIPRNDFVETLAPNLTTLPKIVSRFENKPTLSPQVEVIHTMFYAANFPVMQHTYQIINKSGITYPKFYASVFFDFDIRKSTENFAIWNDTYRMGVTYVDNDIFQTDRIGVKLISQGINSFGPPLFYPTFNGEFTYTNQDYYKMQKNGVVTSLVGGSTGKDVHFMIGRGPGVFAPNDTAVLSFLMIPAANQSELISTAALYGTNSIINLKNEYGNPIVSYPNPAKDELTFKLKSLPTENFIFKVNNMIGVTLINTSITPQMIQEQNLYTANVFDLPSGIYSFSFSNSKTTYFGKFVKE